MPKIPYLEDIKEPCYFDFLYEEIRQQSEAEIINTILFESIMRTNDIKVILESNISSEKLLNNTLNSSTKNTTLSNPLYERIDNFKEEVNQFYGMLKILKIENDDTISQEEMIQLFFNGNTTQYRETIEILSKIKTLLEELNININLNIDFDSFSKDKNNKYNPITIFNKYGIDYKLFREYQYSIKTYINEQNKYKNMFLIQTESNNLKSYEKAINKLVKKYREFSYTKLHIGYKTNIYIGKRPISNLLNTLELKIPYLPNDIGTNRLKKALKQLETILDENEIKADTKQYLSFISKESLDIVTMKPDTFSRILFIYDWLEYVSNNRNHTLYNSSQKDKIKHLQSIYPTLKKLKYKTLENYLNILRSFIRDLENIT